MKIFTKQKLLVLGVCVFFLAAAYIMSSVSPVLAQDIQVIVNGQNVQFPDQKPFINKDNRTLVPVRAPMEAAGAAVTWNDAARQATVAKGDKTAVFTIGSRQYAVNGEIKQMDTEAQIAGNRTVFPIRFVAEAIGLTVTWNEKTQTVGITAPAVPVNNPEVKPGTTQPEVTTPSTQSQKPMTSLTVEAKARLMAYPYQAGIEIITPLGEYESDQTAQTTQSWLDQKALIKSNQQFFFDSNLCFDCTGKYPCRVRGVLQTRNNDGTIKEQDIEFGFAYGTPIVPIGEPPQPSRLFDGNDFIALAPPVKL